MTGRDLGTYHVRVELANGDGFLMSWETGARYTHGTYGSYHPLDAMRIEPTWASEAELIESVEYQFRDGNYSCDCNLRPFLARAHQRPEPGEDENPCGEMLAIQALTLICPDGTEKQLNAGPQRPMNPTTDRLP